MVKDKSSDCSETITDIFILIENLSSVVHSASLHSLKSLAHSSLLDLSLLLLLRILEVSTVAKLHHVSRLVDLTLETADCRLDRFSLSNLYLDGNSKLSARCYES